MVVFHSYVSLPEGIGYYGIMRSIDMMYSYTCTLVLCRSRASRASRSNDRSWQPGIAIELLDLRNQRLNQLLDLIHSWARADVGIAAVPTWRWASSSNQQCWWSRCVCQSKKWKTLKSDRSRSRKINKLGEQENTCDPCHQIHHKTI